MKQIPHAELNYKKKLGKGGCGEVYLAETKIQGEVAVKKTIMECTDEIWKEFLNEAELLSQMNSPYIIRFFGTSQAAEGLCIVMEYASQGSLYDYLKKLRREKNESAFSWEQRLKIAQDITRGLLCIHSQRVLHRDMKSLNILLDHNLKAKISDFGLSAIKMETQIKSTLRVKNDVYGSLLWKAPETFSTSNPYTDKANFFHWESFFWRFLLANYLIQDLIPM